MTGKVVLTGYILVPDADLSSVLNALPKHIELSRAEEGCDMFEVAQDQGDHNKFLVREIFRTQQHFDFHQQRVKGSCWERASRNAERHYKIRGA